MSSRRTPPDLIKDPETEVFQDMMDEDVKRALDSLPHDYKMVVLLADLEGFSYKEIAEILDCPVGTVMSRLYRGRKMLEKTLLEYARKYGYIRSGEPTKMRSRKDDTKKKTKKSSTSEGGAEVEEKDLSDDEELALLSSDSDETFEVEVREERDGEDEEFDLK